MNEVNGALANQEMFVEQQLETEIESRESSSFVFPQLLDEILSLHGTPIALSGAVLLQHCRKGFRLFLTGLLHQD